MFRITGLSPDLFCHLVGLSDAELVALNARRVVADRANAFPDRIEMRDAEPGEVLILANYEHLQGATPYRARHAVYFLEQAKERYDTTDTVPDVFRNRLISLRAFDTADMMLDADAVAGEELAEAKPLLLGPPRIVPACTLRQARLLRRPRGSRIGGSSV